MLIYFGLRDAFPENPWSNVTHYRKFRSASFEASTITCRSQKYFRFFSKSEFETQVVPKSSLNEDLVWSVRFLSRWSVTVTVDPSLARNIIWLLFSLILHLAPSVSETKLNSIILFAADPPIWWGKSIVWPSAVSSSTISFSPLPYTPPCRAADQPGKNSVLL